MPAIICLAIFGDGATDQLLLLSQVILSMQLSFAVVPLVLFTSDRAKMGEFAISTWTKILTWLTALVIMALNIYNLVLQVAAWMK